MLHGKMLCERYLVKMYIFKSINGSTDNLERKNKYDILKRETGNMAVLWKNSRGIAPDTVADKLDDAMLSWMVELTDTLKI